MNSEPIYWLFSSSAQAVAAFIAFLLTGFAIVLQLMDSAADRDETLRPIHDELKSKYHQFTVVLSVLTGLSIVSSLGMIYLNGLQLSWIGWPALGVFVINAGVICGGIWFVTRMIDPGRFGKTAVALLAEEEKRVRPTGVQTTRAEFFDAFVELERDIREFIKQKKLGGSGTERQRVDFYFRQMVEILRRSSTITDTLYERLMEINKSRNLIFHGHLEEVDEAFVRRVREIHAELKPLLKIRRKRTGA